MIKELAKKNRSYRRFYENKKITEDELKQAEEQIQKLTDKSVEEIDKILADKEKEVMSV